MAQKDAVPYRGTARNASSSSHSQAEGEGSARAGCRSPGGARPSRPRLLAANRRARSGSSVPRSGLWCNGRERQVKSSSEHDPIYLASSYQ